MSVLSLDLTTAYDWRADVPGMPSWHPSEAAAMDYADRLVRGGAVAVVVWFCGEMTSEGVA